MLAAVVTFFLGQVPDPASGPAPATIVAPAAASPAIASPASPPPAAKPVPKPAGKRRVLVLDPTSDSVSSETRKVIASLIVGELQNDTGVDVLSADELQKMAAFEAEKQSLGCDSASCLSELAGAVGAELIIFGNAATLGTITLVNLSLFDAAHATAVQRAQVQIDHPEEMPAKIAVATRKLFGEATVAQPSASPSSSSPVVPIAFIAGGAAVFVLGGVVDLFSPTSHNGTIDAVDFVGPVAYIVGGIAVVVGTVGLVTGE